MNFDELLHQYEYTRYKLYKATGISQSSLAKYANGISDPINMPLSSAKKIADCFKITIDELYAKLDRED